MAVKRALISVSDKTGVVDFARGLHELGVEIISTGGTMKAIADAGIPVKSVSEVTGFPEMMDGRVKTLHPKVHGGILGRRGQDDAIMEEHQIQPIDMVVVNLYPFAQTVAREGCSLEDAVENIDIGGPSMVRAAAKNYKYVAVVVDPKQYDDILERIKNDQLTDEFRLDLSRKAFLHTGLYDCAIADYLTKQVNGDNDTLPDIYSMAYVKLQDLRYGENPHQKARIRKQQAASLLPSSSTARNFPTTISLIWKQHGILPANGKTSRHASSSSTRTHAAPLLEAQLLKHSREPSTLTANLLSAASLP